MHGETMTFTLCLFHKANNKIQKLSTLRSICNRVSSADIWCQIGRDGSAVKMKAVCYS